MEDSQNQSKEMTKHSTAMTTIASVGWILLVIAVGVFFLIGAPYYYEKGVADKYQQDFDIVEDWLRGDEALAKTVSGSIVSIQNKLIIIERFSSTPNPLAVEEVDNNVIIQIDGNTKIFVDTFRRPAEYFKEVESARALGLESDGVEPPFATTESSLDDLQVGMGISVSFPEGEADINDDSNSEQVLVASEIKYVIYLDDDGNPIDLSNSDQRVPVVNPSAFESE
jgi:hypothetical protein